jgi:hypothetical protein
MTTAVCFSCFELKFGAFVPCDKCGAEPKSEHDLIMSMAMTDHHFDQSTLEEICAVAKENGELPLLHPDNYNQIRELIKEAKEADDMGPMLDELLDEEEGRANTKRPWWKFW